MQLVANNHKVQHFARYEFKYLLNAELRQQVEDEISHFMYFDGHVDPELDNAYYVRSLYFDNPARTSYYEKTDGIRTRKKYRIRTYSRNQSDRAAIFLEEKGRYNQRTFKNRVQIDNDNLSLILEAARHQELIDNFPEVELIEKFVFSSLRRSHSPVVLVDYIRRPYTSDYDMNFRATFDSFMQAAATNMLFPSNDVSWIAIDAGWSVLEIKFNRRIPAWFHRVLQAYDLTRLSISKFCRGMEVCGLAENLE